MDFLPLEILNHILNYLPLKDKLEKRVVCKKFNQLLPNLQISSRELDILRDAFYEMGSLCLIPELLNRNFTRQINDIRLEITKNNQTQQLIYIDTYPESTHILIRRQIIVDVGNQFFKLDDLDPYPFYEGIKKLFHCIKNILSLTKNTDHLIFKNNNQIIEWKQTLMPYLIEPFASSLHLMRKYDELLENPADYDFIGSNQYLIYEKIDSILQSRIKKIGNHQIKECLQILFEILL
jgi:hypothetical protein